jgi:hypothetical protein
MHETPSLLVTRSLRGEDAVDSRVRRTVVLIPAMVIGAGTVIVQSNPRLGLICASVVLGWTRLVGP